MRCVQFVGAATSAAGADWKVHGLFVSNNFWSGSPVASSSSNAWNVNFNNGNSNNNNRNNNYVRLVRVG